MNNRAFRFLTFGFLATLGHFGWWASVGHTEELPTINLRSSQPKPTAQLRRHPCKFRVKGLRMNCGTLVVPEQRTSKTSARTIALEYAVVKSQSLSPKSDPVVFLTGGPGSSVFAFLDRIPPLSLRDSRDIILLEQRGNGYSEPNLLCNPRYDSANYQSIQALRLDTAKKCKREIARRGVKLAAYNTTESSHDLEDLRLALKVSRWNVTGTSFGTFWALRYVSLYPNNTRSLLLDSPYPLQADPRDHGVSQLNALDEVLHACEGSEPCRSDYPDLRQSLLALFENIRASSPSRVTAERQIAELMAIIAGTNFESSTVSFVPRLIDAIVKNNEKTVAAILGLDIYGIPQGVSPEKRGSDGLTGAMPCMDDAFPGLPEYRLTLSSPSWPSSLKKIILGNDPFKICNKVWNLPKSAPVLQQPVISDIPTLILVGGLDPTTPPAYGTMMAATLANATVVTIPNRAHAILSFAAPCTLSIMSAFLDAPTSPTDISCNADQIPRFVRPTESISLPGE